MPIVTLTPAFIASKLECPPGQKHIEFCDKQVRGLFIDVLSGASSQPTWNYRFKVNGKTKTRRLGRLADIALDDVRKQVALLKAEHALGRQQQTVEAGQGITLDRFMRENYRGHAKVHKRSYVRDDQLYTRIAPKFGHLPLRQITRLQVQQFQSALLEEGLSKATVNHHIQLMRRMLNLAVSWEMLDRNVLTGIPQLILDNQVTDFLDEEQVERLMQVLQTDKNCRVSLILIFLLSTGARLREALCVQWKHVNLKGATWTIPASNSKSKRAKSLPLSSSSLWVIQQLDTAQSSEYLFPSPVTGKPYTTITRAWYRIRKKAGLPGNVRIHDLRHAHAARLVQAGRSLYEVQRLLGHADPRTSLRYAHLSMKTMQEAANAAALTIPSVSAA